MSSKQRGLYIPATQVWDVNDIYNTKDLGEGLKELLVRMYQNLNSMALAVNKKETGLYPREEFICGQQYYPEIGLNSSSEQAPKLRQVTRKVIAWVNPSTGLYKPLPNASTDTVAHGLVFDANSIPTNIYGAAYDPSVMKSIPLPWIADTGDNIAVWLDGTNVNIKTFGTSRTNFTIANIVIEYLKF